MLLAYLQTPYSTASFQAFNPKFDENSPSLKPLAWPKSLRINFVTLNLNPSAQPLIQTPLTLPPRHLIEQPQPTAHHLPFLLNVSHQHNYKNVEPKGSATIVMKSSSLATNALPLDSYYFWMILALHLTQIHPLTHPHYPTPMTLSIFISPLKPSQNSIPSNPKIHNLPITVLIDSGSSHNILQTRIANHLHLPIKPTPPFSVMVGNNAFINCQGLCLQ